MKIAVVIPCHNAETWLGQTLGCLLDQTRLPTQVVVVDDASTDGSRAVAQAFAARRPELFTLTVNPDPGSASRARIAGYAQVADAVEAVMFLDADDLLRPDTLQALADGLEAGSDGDGPARGVAVCPWVRLELIDAADPDTNLNLDQAGPMAAGSNRARWESRPMSAPARPAGVSALDAWLTGWYHPPCAVLWSRSAYQATGGWDPAWCVNDDGDLMLRALVQQTPLHTVDAGLSYYRRLPGDQVSLSDRRHTPEGLASRLRVFDKIGRRLEQAGRIDDHRPALTHAIWQVRREAVAAAAPDVARRAERLGRQWTPPRWRSWRQRWGRGPTRSAAAYPESAEAFTPERVTWGQQRAAAAGLTNQPQATTSAVRFTTPPPPPTVSVILPTYNRAAASERAICSVLAQSLADFELLVVDDASTDDTADRCRAIDDPRITVHRQPTNGGVARARNAGIRGARGTYLAFLDSDDWWEPSKLERQVAALADLDESWAMVYCGMKAIDAAGQTRVTRPTQRGDLAEAMLRENLIQPGGSGPLMRRAAVPGVGLFDPALSAIEDWDYWLRLCQLYRIEVVPEPLCVYDDSDDGQADRRSRHVRRNIAARRQFFDKHRHALVRAGLAQRFLWDTVERCLRPTVVDPVAARSLAWRAIGLGPASLEAWRMLRWARAEVAVFSEAKAAAR